VLFVRRAGRLPRHRRGPRHQSFGASRLAKLIKQVYESDPLTCPRCTDEMRVIALIDNKRVIRPKATIEREKPT
jgi:hypothetical protein